MVVISWKTFIPLLIFLVILISPAYAVLSVETNQTLTLTANCRDINCYNNTAGDNNIYCAIACEGFGVGGIIYRTNATFGNLASCDVSGFSSVASSIAWVNSSQVDITQRSSNSLWKLNVTDFGSCSVLQSLTGKVGVNNFAMAHYLSGSDSWLYVGKDGNVINEVTGNQIYLGGWGTRYKIAIPDKSSNVTMWVTDQSTQYFEIIERLTNGVEDGEYVNLEDTYGIKDLEGFDIVRVDASTTWLYLLDYGATSTSYILYRTNLTEAEETNPATFSNFNINAGSTINVGDFCLEVDVTSALNGTLIWWFNTTNFYNESVTTAPLTNQPFQYCFEITEGYYVWYLDYLDSAGDTWRSQVINFYATEFGMIPFIVNKIVDLFGLDDSDDGKGLLAIFISLLISLAIAMKIEDERGKIFFACFIVLILMFWWLGWLPTWIGLLVIIFIATLFSSMIREIFMGG